MSMEEDKREKLLGSDIGGLSFLRSSNALAEKHSRSYHFIHLTFQEYFATRYFVRKWKEDKNLQCANFESRSDDSYEYSCMEFLHLIHTIDLICCSR
jgi:predicted NACHT family NTPase